MGQRTSQSLKWSLRLLGAISACIGIGFIIWAVVIQNPPKSSLPVGLVILGSFALCVALLGFFHSFCGRCCLSVFLLISGLVTIGELALVISLFADLDKAVNNLVQYDLSQQEKSKSSQNQNNRVLLAPSKGDLSDLEQKYRNDLEIGRYVFLVFVLLEFVVLLVTIVLRIRHPYTTESDDFEEQRSARSAMAQIQMENLKSSTQQRGTPGKTTPAGEGNFYTSSSKLYKSVTKKMTQKYGEFTADPAFQKKWWQSLPFF